MYTKIEFAVQMSCESCVKAVRNALENVNGIGKVDVDLEKNTVVVETNLTSEDILKRIQSTGKKAVVKGLEGILAAVAVFDLSKEIKGVVRFVQITANICVIEGTIDGLKPGEHGLYIHESGDLSEGCNSVGDCFNPKNYDILIHDRAYGSLGSVIARDDGRTSFRLQDSIISLSDVIGRSLVITEKSKEEPDGVGKKVSCGIIARSSALLQNPKTICACDGVSIWDERNQPKPSL